MKIRNTALKTFTILSSILLVAAYVAYSSGAFDGPSETTSPFVPLTNTVPSPAAVKHDPAYMSGSKSMVFKVVPAIPEASGTTSASGTIPPSASPNAPK